MDIKYKIKFHTYWHCGSGLAAGADADMLVIKDKDNLPYVPGKTIKGLVREAVDVLYSNKKGKDEYKAVFDNYTTVFGISGDQENSSRSDSFFKDAVLSTAERKYIVDKEWTAHLYHTISGTAIEDDGTAKKNSLRKIQVCVPCELESEILNVPDQMAEAIINGLRYIKRLGAWRNRGLGRCTIEAIIEKKGGKA